MRHSKTFSGETAQEDAKAFAETLTAPFGVSDVTVFKTTPATSEQPQQVVVGWVQWTS